MSAIPMQPGQKMTLSITAFDGSTPPNPVTPLPIGTVVSYSSNNTNAVTVVLNADGVTATATAVAPPGTLAGATVTGEIVFTDQAGTHTYVSTDTITVGQPVSPIKSITLNNTTPA